MKNPEKSCAVVAVAAMLMFAMFLLGACEEIVIEKVIDSVFVDRPVPGPIQYVPRFVASETTKECESTDTMDVEVVLKDIWKNGAITKDTLLSLTTACHAKITIRGYVLVPRDTIGIVRDSIVYEDRVEYIDRPVIVYDTVPEIRIEQRVVYEDTLYYPVYNRPVYSVPDELQPYVADFYTQAGARGWNLIGGVMIIQYTNPDDLPGENWNSHSYWIGGSPYGQMVIEVNAHQPYEQLYSSVLRELARLQMKRKYITDTTRIMCPLFDPARIVLESPDKEPYLADLFQNPI